MTDRNALDMKLREMEHTCIGACLPTLEMHYTPDVRFIRVTFRDLLRFLIARVRAGLV